MADNSPWKVGRKFEVNADVADRDTGRIYRRGHLYEVEKFGMIREVKRETGEPVTRLWQSTDGERFMLLQHIIWDDDRPCKISNGLRRFIEQSPASKYVRGFVRQEIGIVPEKDKTPTTYDGWMDYIAGAEIVNPMPSSMAAPPPPAQELYVALQVSGHERVFGHSDFRRTDSWAGVMEIPMSTIEEGEDAIRDYIVENYSEYLERDIGEPTAQDESVTDSDGFVIDNTNLPQVLRAHREGQLETIPARPDQQPERALNREQRRRFEAIANLAPTFTAAAMPEQMQRVIMADETDEET